MLDTGSSQATTSDIGKIENTSTAVPAELGSRQHVSS